MKKISSIFVIFLLFFISNSSFSQSVVINEILTSNTTVNTDEDGAYADWVELYNAGSTAISLNGYGLSDDPLLPYKWTFPDVSLAAGQYLLIYCDDKNRIDPTKPLHSNFKISSGGEDITLTNASNTTVDFVPATAIVQNTSFGRLPNGTGDFAFINSPTPNTANLQPQGVVINEILTSNTTVNVDEDGSYGDWVELYNAGSTTVSLNGYGLSDDPLLPYKWTFPNVSLAAGQYLLIWCDDKDRIDPTKPLHANFKISSSGEVITLTNVSGDVVDFVPATVIVQNTSFGRLPNGTGSFTFLNTPTPNAANSQGEVQETLSPPTFSKESGFLTAGFNLTLSTTVAGATILYTLDGSDPSAANIGGKTYQYKNSYSELVGQPTGPLLNQSFETLQYSAPIAIVDRSNVPNKISAISTTYDFDPFYIPTSPVYKGTVVRAKIIKAGNIDSKIITKTYYISPQGSSKYSIPVISLSTDEDKMFDYNKGIDVAGVDYDNWRIANPTEEYPQIGNVANFYRSGSPSEITANMSYFVNGAEVLNQDIGIRVRGGSSRVAQNRSFTIYARSDYGNDSMHYKFYDNKTFNSFNRIALHNSGNDFNQTLFRDALCNRLAQSLNILVKGYQPAITFVNGEYWGIMSLRDKVDADYLLREFNIPTNEVDVLEDGYGSDGGVYYDDQVKEGDNLDYLNMISYLESNSLATQANYDYITTRLDPENFKDYFISNIFLDNSDWPSNNIVFWRKKTAGYEPNAPYGQDGRWRWLFHDLDDTFAISHPDQVDRNSLAIATDPIGTDYPNPQWATLVLRRMLENPNFKTEFINRFADLLNTSFKTERVLDVFNEMKNVLAPEMSQQYDRWKAPYDDGDWNYFLDNEINFINKRPAIQRDQIRSKFGIASNINATLDVSDANAGYIKMNTIDVKEGTDGITTNPYPWTGIYFSNIPVKIKAIAKPGFVFSHWTGASTSTDPEITITSSSNFSVTAVFNEDASTASQPIYFWMMNSNIANNQPLTSLNSTYKTGSVDGTIQYESCLLGYPFTSTDANWRKASMERRNSPTDINYIPTANNDLDFASSDMKGLQIKEPFQHSDGQGGTLDNTLIFNIPSTGFKDIKFSFAAINELTNATAISLDYSLNAGTPIFQVTSSFPITNAYQLFTYDLSSIVGANNNPNLKIRMRFTGTSDMTVDTGARITFNNIAVHGTQTTLDVAKNSSLQYSVYPNPFSDSINIIGINNTKSATYQLFAIDGKLIKKGNLDNTQIYLNDLSKGMYLLQLSSDGKIETKKIIKK